VPEAYIRVVLLVAEETRRIARLPHLERDQPKPEDQQFYDAIADSRGSVRGPYGVLLHSPDLAARVAHTGTYVRYNLDLPEALRETIILATAWEIKSQYEFFASRGQQRPGVRWVWGHSVQCGDLSANRVDCAPPARRVAAHAYRPWWP
jgi:hypothetical protein